MISERPTGITQFLIQPIYRATKEYGSMLVLVF